MTCLRLLILLLVVFVTSIYSNEDKNIVKARVESCSGCKLNALVQVKKFIYEDLPNYVNAEFKKIPGAPPELVFLNAADEEVERIPLNHLGRDECNDLLTERGFKLVSKLNEL